MEDFVRATTSSGYSTDMFSYRRTRLEMKDGSTFREGPRLIEDFDTRKRLNDNKPGRITPQGEALKVVKKGEDENPNTTLLTYMWTLSENFAQREIDLDFIRSILNGGIVYLCIVYCVIVCLGFFFPETKNLSKEISISKDRFRSSEDIQG